MTSGRYEFATAAPRVLTVFDAVAALAPPDRSDPAVAEFADQFALDVSVLDKSQRGAFFAAVGDQAFAVVQQIYAHDFVPRVRTALDAVFGPSEWPALKPYDDDTWALLERFMVEVARLTTLDPTLTELVRLRGARLHDCAVCKSRRSRDALDAGADESVFDAVDSHADSDLPAATKAALALTDTLIRTPDDVSPELAAIVRAHLSPEQTVEVALDVMRNAANKIAVALGADAAAVTDGVELFTTDADGNLTVDGSR